MARERRFFGRFANASRRSKWIIAAGAILVVFVGASAATATVARSSWLCKNACHRIMDDAVKAHEHSAHSEIECAKCHLEVGGNPLSVIAHDLSVLNREIRKAITNEYRFPLNKGDKIALTMSSEQCTQCHELSKLKAAPEGGIKMDHKLLASQGIACTVCHNRVAHNEDFKLTLKDPSGKLNQKHTDFMTMEACFRCHSQEPTEGVPSGECTKCHVYEPTELPASHNDPVFAVSSHGKLASAEESRAPWFTAKTATSTPKAKQSATQSGGTSARKPYSDALALKTVSEVNVCSTCHAESYCDDCHGLKLPHPSDWAKEAHGKASVAHPQVCGKCHGSSTASFCSNCHHGTNLKHRIDPRLTWLAQHARASAAVGKASCIRSGGCHSLVYCAICHAAGGKMPSNGPAF